MHVEELENMETKLRLEIKQIKAAHNDIQYCFILCFLFRLKISG